MGKSGDKVFAKGIRVYFYDDWWNTDLYKVAQKLTHLVFYTFTSSLHS